MGDENDESYRKFKMQLDHIKMHIRHDNWFYKALQHYLRENDKLNTIEK